MQMVWELAICHNTRKKAKKSPTLQERKCSLLRGGAFMGFSARA